MTFFIFKRLRVRFFFSSWTNYATRLTLMVNRDIPLRSVPIFSRTNGCRLEFEQSIFYLFPAGQQGYRYSIRSNTVNRVMRIVVQFVSLGANFFKSYKMQI